MRLSLALISLAYLLFVSVTMAEESKSDTEIFAVVDGVEISTDELARRLRIEYRREFYHGQPPKEEVEQFERNIAGLVIDEVLLANEAKRKSIVPDREVLDSIYEKRISGLTAQEIENQPEFIDRLKARINDEQLLVLLEEQVRAAVPVPTEDQVREYYKKNPDMFTTPSRDHVQMILLSVPAYAGQDEWESARGRAAGILKQIREGADFAEMAMIHSSDESAANGGDMGYLHQGMLGGVADQIVKLMSSGDVSEPVLLLEGVGIFKLLDRTKPELNDFEVVKERAEALLLREMKDQAWSGLKAELRAKAEISIVSNVISGLAE